MSISASGSAPQDLKGASRSRALDVVRAAALFLVLACHLRPCPRELNPVLHDITSIGATGGWAGVDLFFVLSGFLISGLLFHIMLEVNFWRAARSSGDPRAWYLYAVAFLLGSLALGIVVAAIVEYPAVRLRGRLFPSRSEPLGSSRTEQEPFALRVEGSQRASAS